MLITVLVEGEGSTAGGGADQAAHLFDVDPDFLLSEFAKVFSVEVNVNVQQVTLHHNGRPLNDWSKTLRQIGIEENDILLVKNIPMPPINSIIDESDRVEIEQVRQRILTDANVRNGLEQTRPSLVKAAESNPAEFHRLMRSFRAQMFPNSTTTTTNIMNKQKDVDYFSTEGQGRIEEMIKQQNINQNLETAMEYHPESFGSVTMLYISCKVNNKPIKAFVDCGAQTTIMSQTCATKCDLDRLVDSRFSGIAKGVGTSKIIGRVHSVQMQIGGQYLPCSVTIIEGNGPDMLLGLDMLKRHQCCIDLFRGVLVANGQDIPFLPESEIPKEDY